MHTANWSARASRPETQSGSTSPTPAERAPAQRRLRQRLVFRERDPGNRLVVFGSADCNFSNAVPWAEQVFAVHASTGKVAWRFQPDAT